MDNGLDTSLGDFEEEEELESHKPTEGQYFYSNKMGRVILKAMEEVIGLEQMIDVLRAAGLPHLINNYPPNNLKLGFPFEAVSGLQAAMEKVFGIQEGRELNRKVGHACLNVGLREFNPILGIADLPVRLLPLAMKLHVGFDMFAMVFNRFSDQVVTLSEDDENYLWIIERCPVCWGRHTDEPCCHLAVGILEEGLTWATGGRQFRVEEISCVAKGDETCTIAIGKRPIE